MENDFVQSDGPFAAPNFRTNTAPSEYIAEAVLESLPKFDELPSGWLGNPNVIENEEYYSDDAGSAWPENASSLSFESPAARSITSNASEDYWCLSLQESKKAEARPFRTWETITNPAFKDTCLYISETESRTWDLALQSFDDNETNVYSIKLEIFLTSLTQLGFGRESVLFIFNEDGDFSWRVQESRVTGLSIKATQSVVGTFAQSGKLFRNIRKLAIDVYRKEKHPPATIAFAQIVGSLLLQLEAVVSDNPRARTIIQLEVAFKAPFKILTLLQDAFNALQRFATDQESLSCLFEISQEVERSEICLMGVMQHILHHVSRPWLDALGGCIGLTGPTAGSAFLSRKFESLMDWSATLDNEDMFDEAFPKFLQSSDRQLIMQIFQSMKVLDSQGKHALINSGFIFDRLEWSFTWKEIAEAETRPLRSCSYETVDKRSNLPSESSCRRAETSYEILSFELIDTFEHIERPKSSQDSSLMLRNALKNALDPTNMISRLKEQPTLAISAMSSFSTLIAHRAKQVNQACLKELFGVRFSSGLGNTRRLTDHLKILHRFLLMGNGMFTTRLSHALFDTSLDSTERMEGHVRTGQMGLRLASRKSWPPASSELHLALSGILALSFGEDGTLKMQSTPVDLPGGLSFALRELSDEEIDRCLDPDALEALDFLKIHYSPPPPLDIVILPSSLDKYDQIFILLLRLQRLKFVVNHVFRSYQASRLGGSADLATLRFIYVARNFTTSFSEHVVMSAIAEPWNRFMTSIKALEDAVEVTGLTAASGTSWLSSSRITERHGIEQIRQLHSDALDAMLSACLLRKRHEKVRALLDDVFRLVLRFAALKHVRGVDDDSTMAAAAAAVADEEEQVSELYRRFRKLAGLFIQVCKGLAVQQEGDSDGAREVSGLSALIARLTMNGFYEERMIR